MSRKLNKTREAWISAVRENAELLEQGDFISASISGMLDKSFYEGSVPPQQWNFPEAEPRQPMEWLHFTRLPTAAEGREDLYRPKERMQGFLCTAQGLGCRVAYRLVRRDRRTDLYAGVEQAGVRPDVLLSQAQQALSTNLPGVSTEPADRRFVDWQLSGMSYAGAVTGQPSVRFGERENPLQTMDRIAAGIRNRSTGRDCEYALTVVSEPVSDAWLRETIARAQQLKTELSAYAGFTSTSGFSENQGDSKTTGGGISVSGALLSLALTAVCLGSGFGAGAALMLAGEAGRAVGNLLQMGLSLFHSRTSSEGVSRSESYSVQRINYSVKYCTDLLDKMIARLERGRNMGFWNTGVYVLADSEDTVRMVNAVVRSVYAGQDTYQEPLRTFSFGAKPELYGAIRGCRILPLPVGREMTDYGREASGDDSWHVFGGLYESLSTPMTTEELAIVMGLPRKDVPGIRIKKDAVEFSTNPPAVEEGERWVVLGDILDMGAPTGDLYRFDLDQLNRHAVNVGSNGGGKSFTTRVLLEGSMAHGVPFLVIDPVKLDYVYWADRYNQEHAEETGFRPIRIYAPSMTSIPGVKTPLTPLRMNPFIPCAAKGAPLNILGHIGSVLGLLQQVLAMGDFLPMLLEEAVYDYTAQVLGAEILESSAVDPQDVAEYPLLSGLRGTVDHLLGQRGYSEENTRNFRAAFETRINRLTRGWKRDFFESDSPTPAEELFESGGVITLAGVTGNDDKAFLMALLLQAIAEYRISRYQFDEEYRDWVERHRLSHHHNCLAHLTVVEEAHRVLKAPQGRAGDADPQAAAAERFCEMLSEIREPGEGLMIVDQYPSRLIPDAVKNTNVKLIHRLLARDDRESMAGCMSLTDEQSRLLSTLRLGNAIISSEQDDSAMWLHVRK